MCTLSVLFSLVAVVMGARAGVVIVAARATEDWGARGRGGEKQG